MEAEFYQSIVDHLPVGVFVLHVEDHAVPSNFRFIYANPASETLLGIPRQRFVGKSLNEALPTVLTTALPEIYREVLHEQTIRDLDNIYYHGDGIQGYFQVQISALSNDAILLVLHNVSEQKRIEEERKQTALALEIYNRKLEASNRELEEFAYVASHDLQEPLRKIMAFGDRLRSKYTTVLDDGGRDYLLRMQNAAARMQSLISDLLNLSRISTRGQPFEVVDLHAIVTDVLRDLETTMEQHGGAVEVSTLPTLAADPVQMRQLFQNLIGNALKFHEDGTAPFVKITSRLEHGANAAYPSYTIAVADHGIGFEEKYVDRIFQPFQRLHGAQRYEGTGMGLAICRRIVERHGGVIRATSQPGLGATFTISLPASQPTTEELTGELSSVPTA